MGLRLVNQILREWLMPLEKWQAKLAMAAVVGFVLAYVGKCLEMLIGIQNEYKNGFVLNNMWSNDNVFAVVRVLGAETYKHIIRVGAYIRSVLIMFHHDLLYEKTNDNCKYWS